MDADNREELNEFIQQLTACQSNLRAFILSALGNYADSSDVLQRTNLALWRKATEFRPGARFLPWALAVARFEILAFLRDQGRDRHVFSSDVVELMFDTACQEIVEPTERQLALRECLQKLPARNRELLWHRYAAEKSLREVAEATHRSVDSVKCLFFRIRRSLERCIESKLSSNLS